MKLVKYIVVELSSYDPNNGYRKWYELQPQYDNDNENIYINMENINESNR